MSIFDIKINEYEQRLISKKEDKEQYGEINTPFSLIENVNKPIIKNTVIVKIVRKYFIILKC